MHGARPAARRSTELSAVTGDTLGTRPAARETVACLAERRRWTSQPIKALLKALAVLLVESWPVGGDGGRSHEQDTKEARESTHTVSVARLLKSSSG